MNTRHYKNFFMIISLVTILSTSANAEHERSSEYGKCINDTRGIAMNSQYASCAEDEFNRQEKVLKALYIRLKNSATKEQQVLLEKGKNAWINYRENWCHVEEQSAFAPGGLANYYYCLLEKTEKQIDVIKSFEFETFN